jgi:hypothetical protein
MSWKRKVLWLPAWVIYFYVCYLALSWESPTATWIGPSDEAVASLLRVLAEAFRGIPDLLIFLVWFLTFPFHPYPCPYC